MKYNGKQVFISNLLPTMKPRRHLAAKRWHAQRAYATRVQKKWTKRFGETPDSHVIETRDGYFVSRKAYHELLTRTSR